MIQGFENTHATPGNHPMAKVFFFMRPCFEFEMGILTTPYPHQQYGFNKGLLTMFLFNEALLPPYSWGVVVFF